MRNDLFSCRILMCPPTHYAIEYSINPWMDTNQGVKWKLARQQWQDLHHLIVRLGGYVESIDPQPGLPDMVFTANAGFVHSGNKVILSKFAHSERSGEEPYFNLWFEQNGFEVIRPRHVFEGAGDMLYCGEEVFFGHGFRSDIDSRRELEAYHGISSHKLTLADPYFYHLDTCFCPLGGSDGDNEYMYYPKAFANPDALRESMNDACVIEVVEEDAKKFACNAVVMGDSIIIPAGCDTTQKQLESLGFNVYQTPMSEFIKSGGACKCLTLKLSEGLVS